MNIQWYPGHMTKAVRMMQEDIKLIDIVIELLDARVPLSSKNPDIDTLANGKFRLILLNKSDLADPAVTGEWVRYYREKGIAVLEINARSGGGMKSITETIRETCKEKIERDRKRGILNRPLRAMIVGIPNVGKSTFINSYAGKACTKTGNKPGVTKGKQWIHINNQVELLDTPGILWPKFEDQEVGIRLAYIGSIKDDILNVRELALSFITYLTTWYPGVLAGKYEVDEASEAYDILGQIAANRHCLLKGEQLDYDKAAMILLENYRNGKLGRITLERPDMETEDRGNI
ncbi:MAG: ribosome biogenesis GTPase YlqF [Lachnospiraceae bacterium]|nr:ribosome biogenesis GTPase YlqF [Lachnospiraceae bacterium]